MAIAVVFWPHDVGQWTQQSDALWIRTVLLISMLCIACFRSIVTKDRLEQGFMTLAILLSLFPQSPAIGSEQLGKSVIGLLLEDRMVSVTCLAIVASALFIVRAMQRDVPRS